MRTRIVEDSPVIKEAPLSEQESEGKIPARASDGI